MPGTIDKPALRMNCLYIYGFCLIAAIAHAEESDGRYEPEAFNKLLAKNSEECRTESGVSQEVFEKAKIKKEMEKDDTKLQCYTACMLQKIGAMNEQGDYKMGKLVRKMPNERAIHFVEVEQKCDGLVGATVCETGMKVYECIQLITGAKFHFE